MTLFRSDGASFPARGASMQRAEWLETMVEAADEGLLVLAPGGEVVAANSSALRMSGLRRDAVIGHRLAGVPGATDWPWSVALDAAASRRPVSVLHTRDGAKLLISG